MTTMMPLTASTPSAKRPSSPAHGLALERAVRPRPARREQRRALARPRRHAACDGVTINQWRGGSNIDSAQANTRARADQGGLLSPRRANGARRRSSAAERRRRRAYAAAALGDGDDPLEGDAAFSTSRRCELERFGGRTAKGRADRRALPVARVRHCADFSDDAAVVDVPRGLARADGRGRTRRNHAVALLRSCGRGPLKWIARERARAEHARSGTDAALAAEAAAGVAALALGAAVTAARGGRAVPASPTRSRPLPLERRRVCGSAGNGDMDKRATSQRGGAKMP